MIGIVLKIVCRFKEKNMNLIQIKFLTLFLTLSFFSILKGNNNDTTTNKPLIEGTIRAKYEHNFPLSKDRFQVRNSRLSLKGNINKTVNYRAQLDLSDRGEMKMLDASINIQPTEYIDFTIGQYKVPFGNENLYAPHLLYFANRAFVGKQMTDKSRDVGFSFRIQNKNILPFNLKAGIFNGNGILDQKKWNNNFRYALRLETLPLVGWKINGGFSSTQPYDLKTNLFEISSTYDHSQFHLESEYIYKQYANNFFAPTHAFSVFGAYNFYINKSYLSKITLLLRFDSMTENHTEKGENNFIIDYGKQRITSGITFSIDKPFVSDIRINYEKFLHKNNFSSNTDDMLVVELVTRF